VSADMAIRAAAHLRCWCSGVVKVCSLNAAVSLLMAWALPVNAAAQSLMDLYRKAEAQDAQFLAARKTLEATLERLPQARAALLPSVNLNASRGRQAGVASFSDAPWIDRAPSTWSWTLQVSQPLLRGASWAGVAQANAQVAQAQAQLELAGQELILRTAQTYLDVMLAAQSVRVMDAQMAAVQEQLTLAQRSFEVGTGTVTDVHEAQTKQALTQSQRVATVTELAGRRAEVERLLGESLNLAPMELVATLPPLNQALEDWRKAALSGHPQVRALQAAQESAKQEVARNERAHWPTLDLTANLATNYSSGSLGSPADLSSRLESHSVGVQLTIPVYAGGAAQSKVREALALQDKAAAELVSMQRLVQMQVQQAFWGVTSGQAQVDALRVAAGAAQNALEGNQIGYRIGTRINPDVLNAQQQLFAALRDLNKARTETLMQGLKLKAAAGALRVNDLAVMELLLEPVK